MSTDEGFVVYAGARGPLKLLDSLHQGLVDLREELIAQRDIAVTENAIEFVKDVLFKSPSAAAAVICGGSRNGRESWKTKEGVSLKQLEERLAEVPSKGEAS